MRSGYPAITAILTGALVTLGAALCGAGQAADASAEDAAKDIEHYREMINDPLANPGYLNVDRGEILWKTAAGSKNVSLEACDLGEGPGKLEGAFAKLPRYFQDTKHVMDLEQRLLWCMENVQGADTTDVLARHFSGPGTTSDMEDLSAFIANKSNGAKIAVPLDHPEEKRMYALGQELFYRRASISDFSCATCHSQDGLHIRLQVLPNFSKPGRDAQASMRSWPTYRVSQSQLRTMQHRLWDCYRQMRMPSAVYASEGITALMVYLNTQAAGGEIAVPSIKR